MPMTDEEFEKEIEDLTAMIRDLRLIKDKGRKRWLKAEIRVLLNTILRD